MSINSTWTKRVNMLLFKQNLRGIELTVSENCFSYYVDGYSANKTSDLAKGP